MEINQEIKHLIEKEILTDKSLIRKIFLNDLLRLNDLTNVKIRFNKDSTNGEFNPIKLFKSNSLSELMNGQLWNYGKNKVFHEGNISIGLARIKGDDWLLFNICKITKDLNKLNAVRYEYETLTQYQKYFGRIIVRFHNSSQNLIRWAKGLIEKLEVIEVLPESFNDDDFPGYENIDLSWDDLNRVISRKDWKTALENQKGVYLITDTNTGKLYVGSAYGKDMILGRWITYAKSGYDKNEIENGEYPNKKFQELVKKEGMGYIKKYFRYSILDIFKSTIDDKAIIARESRWKEVLLSRKFGYNAN